MNVTWTSDVNQVNWDEAVELFRRAPLGLRQPEALRTTFSNSQYRYFLYSAGQLVGAGRAFGDGASCAMICDIVLLPEFQGHGLGRALVSRLAEEAAVDHGKVMLYAEPDKVTFYRKLGFRMMTTAMAIFVNQPAELEAKMLEPRSGSEQHS